MTCNQSVIVIPNLDSYEQVLSITIKTCNSFIIFYEEIRIFRAPYHILRWSGLSVIGRRQSGLPRTKKARENMKELNLSHMLTTKHQCPFLRVFVEVIQETDAAGHKHW